MRGLRAARLRQEYLPKEAGIKQPPTAGIVAALRSRRVERACPRAVYTRCRGSSTGTTISTRQHSAAVAARRGLEGPLRDVVLSGSRVLRRVVSRIVARPRRAVRLGSAFRPEDEEEDHDVEDLREANLLASVRRASASSFVARTRVSQVRDSRSSTLLLPPPRPLPPPPPLASVRGRSESVVGRSCRKFARDQLGQVAGGVFVSPSAVLVPRNDRFVASSAPRKFGIGSLGYVLASHVLHYLHEEDWTTRSWTAHVIPKFPGSGPSRTCGFRNVSIAVLVRAALRVRALPLIAASSPSLPVLGST